MVSPATLVFLATRRLWKTFGSLSATPSTEISIIVGILYRKGITLVGERKEEWSDKED